MINNLIRIYELYYNRMPAEFNCLDVGDPAMRMKLHLQKLQEIVGKEKLQNLMEGKQ